MPTLWTTINKATGTAWTSVAGATLGSSSIMSTEGVPIGLLLALTYSTTSSVTSGLQWTTVSKATGTSWQTINKAT